MKRTILFIAVLAFIFNCKPPSPKAESSDEKSKPEVSPAAAPDTPWEDATPTSVNPGFCNSATLLAGPALGDGNSFYYDGTYTCWSNGCDNSSSSKRKYKGKVQWQRLVNCLTGTLHYNIRPA